MGGNDNELHIRIHFMHIAGKGEAIHEGHTDINESNVRKNVIDDIDGFDTAFSFSGQLGMKFFPWNQLFQETAQCAFIINNHNFIHGFHPFTGNFAQAEIFPTEDIA